VGGHLGSGGARRLLGSGGARGLLGSGGARGRRGRDPIGSWHGRDVGWVVGDGLAGGGSDFVDAEGVVAVTAVMGVTVVVGPTFAFR
jgi:hypothetical protein